MAAGTDPLTWEEALAAGRASTVFTTHTPVPAGIDRFETVNIKHFFEAGLAPSVPTGKILELGRENYDGGHPGVFNMAVMGLRLAQRANGVAKLHGAVSREMFSSLWPGFDHSDVPITSVTNGVHVPTWIDPKMSALAAKYFGGSDVDVTGWDEIYNVKDEELWALRRELRAALVEDVRRRLRASWKKRGSWKPKSRRASTAPRFPTAPGRAARPSPHPKPCPPTGCP
jgi:starch phosphorylase